MTITWDEYRRQCARADTFSLFALQHSRAMLADTVLQQLLDDALANAPQVPLPADHRGGASFHRLRLTLDQVAAVVAALEPGRSTLPPGRAEHLVITWKEYLDWLGKAGE